LRPFLAPLILDVLVEGVDIGVSACTANGSAHRRFRLLDGTLGRLRHGLADVAHRVAEPGQPALQKALFGHGAPFLDGDELEHTAPGGACAVRCAPRISVLADAFRPAMGGRGFGPRRTASGPACARGRSLDGMAA
jgi:hypothetical protein